MKRLLLSLILTLLKRLADPELVEAAKDFVLVMMDLDIPGEQKKQKVIESLRNLYAGGVNVLAETAPHIVNLIIEAAVAWAKAQQR